MIATNDSRRRLHPRMIDADWLVMRDLGEAVDRAAEAWSRPGLVAVDFGCGSAPYKSLFTARGCRYLAADLDGPVDINIDGNGRLLIDDGIADLLLSFQVLEHVRDLDTYLSEARRVLRPGGRMILSTHGVWLYHPHPEDYRRWTRVGLVQDIEARGFQVVQCAPIVGPLGWTTILRATAWRHALGQVPLIGNGVAALLCLAMNGRALIEEAVTPEAIRRDNACVYLTVSQRL